MAARLPVGSPPSPALANLTCGVGYEQDYLKSVGSAAGERVWGIRSMDDVVMVGTYTMGNSKTRGRERREKEAIERLEQLKYHA